MYIARQTLVVFLLTGLLLASCGGRAPASPTPDVDAILTSAIGTVAASFFETQTAIVPPATETFTPTIIPTATSTPLTLSTATSIPTIVPTQIVIVSTPIPNFTFVPSPTGTRFTPTAHPSALASGCNNLRLISDVTIPAGTVLQPRETFTKTWQVENNGTCDWVYLHHLVFISGDSMSGESTRLSKVIPPGKWTQISVDLQAPNREGTYTGYWRFADPDGNVFGSTLTVSIVVRR
ncbi:MAG TPA: NBR1-Ig-like domain-containing protein [Anaerolineales bacterium]|nr:NBR1-Ig-like domain-containing protein [Anaerolineales bacterium]